MVSATSTIWKYPLDHYTVLSIPGFERFLSVGVQDQVPVVWAVVNPTEPHVSVQVWTEITGGHVATGEYLGTFQTDGFVGHVFWRLDD